MRRFFLTLSATVFLLVPLRVLGDEPATYAEAMALARSSFAAGDYGTSRRAAEQARRFDAASPAPAELLGMIAQEQGRVAQRHLAFARKALVDSDENTAWTHLCAAAAADPDSEEVLRAQAELFPHAKSEFDRLVKLAHHVARNGKLDRAEVHLRTALGWFPADPDALRLLERLPHYEEDRIAEAIAALRRIAQSESLSAVSQAADEVKELAFFESAAYREADALEQKTRTIRMDLQSRIMAAERALDRPLVERLATLLRVYFPDADDLQEWLRCSPARIRAYRDNPASSSPSR